MNKLDQILETLKKQADALKARGIAHASVFGSTARQDTHAQSDIDIVIDLDATKPINVFDYAAIKEEIAEMVGGNVDVVTWEGLKAPIRARVENEAVDAF